MQRVRLHDAEGPLHLQTARRKVDLQLVLCRRHVRAAVNGVAGAVRAPLCPQGHGRAVSGHARVPRPAEQEPLADRAPALEAQGHGARLCHEHAQGSVVVRRALQLLAQHLRLDVPERVGPPLGHDEEPHGGDLVLDHLLQRLALELAARQAVGLDERQRALGGQGVEVREEELEVPHRLPQALAAVDAVGTVGLRELLGQGDRLLDGLVVELLQHKHGAQASSDRIHLRLALHCG
mmetsp:Transcript_25398/g.73253  ORF Transcript_25398/g.73253 Transcript_25398/m.73253 type:complete len:236 (-) Transcript_25398:376-1083(-)